MEPPEHLRSAVDDAVSRALRSALDERGLLLSAADNRSALTAASLRGGELLRRMLLHCYPGLDVRFDSERVKERTRLALAFGAVTADLLTPAGTIRSADLLCAVFNLGIGLVDGLCDGDPPTGLQLLHAIRSCDLRAAVGRAWPPGRLRSALPDSLAADPTATFAARVVEAFFELLHFGHLGDVGMRDRVGALLEEALEAERRSVGPAGGDLAESSRLTSVLPFRIIETLAGGDELTASTLLGEALWRIDDLVDLSQDAALGALNALLLEATDLRQILASPAIARSATQAAASLEEGLRAAPGDRAMFLSFVQHYAGLG